MLQYLKNKIEARNTAKRAALHDEVRNYIDNLLTETAVVENLVANMQVDYRALSQHLDLNSIAYEIDSSDIAQELDIYEIINEIDVQDIAGYVDTLDIAENVCVQSVASEMDVQAVADQIDCALVASHINDKVDELVNDRIGELDLKELVSENMCVSDFDNLDLDDLAQRIADKLNITVV